VTQVYLNLHGHQFKQPGVLPYILHSPTLPVNSQTQLVSGHFVSCYRR